MARYIDADKVLETARDGYHSDFGRSMADLTSLREVIEDTPTADVEEVKHGKWLPQVVLGVNTWDCSECKTIGSPHWKRCPICEAKMDGGKEE